MAGKREKREQRVFVGITGASGHAYARGLLRALLAAGIDVDLAVTRAGSLVLAHEEDVETDEDGRLSCESLAAWLDVDTAAAARVSSFGRSEVGSAPASGSALGKAVILCPCSMGTLARVSVGFSSNLVERAADVAIKEGRRLVVVPRETPLSEIHLENLLRLAKLGARILPAAPGFYHRPKSIDDLVDQLVGKVLDAIDVELAETPRWKGLDEPPAEEGIGGGGAPQ